MLLRRRLALPLLIAVLAAGCASDDQASDAPSPTSTVATTSTTAATVGEPVASRGCDAPVSGAVAKERHDVTVGGEDRFYLLTAPEGAEPLPLVVDLHGFSEGAEIHTLQSALGEYGTEEGFVTAFPHGTGEPVRWRRDLGSPDVTFIDAVLDEIGGERCIDTSRIYATGLSNGAMMTSLLACTRAERFAAFAPVNGLLLPDGCDPSRPIPLLTFHGTADPILLFNGGVDTSSFMGDDPGAEAELPEADLDGEGYPATAQAWADLQDCEPEPVDTEEGAVVDRTWTCPDGAAVEFAIIQGQGHGWPGSEFAKSIATIVGPTVEGIDANERMWEFFQRHHLPA